MPKRAEIVQRHAVIRRETILLTDLAEELCLTDRVDPQVRLQIGIQLHDLRRIACLLHDEVDQKRLQV